MIYVGMRKESSTDKLFKLWLESALKKPYKIIAFETLIAPPAPDVTNQFTGLYNFMYYENGVMLKDDHEIKGLQKLPDWDDDDEDSDYADYEEESDKDFDSKEKVNIVLCPHYSKKQ